LSLRFLMWTTPLAGSELSLFLPFDNI
jgi:hypothetical protein